jgi:7,8-dihydroneopterin aldolase/epimerase/oxygenase
MPGLLTIELKHLHFFAFHGLYSEEKKTGNEFEVNLEVSYLPSSGTITDISDTVNYVQLYDLLKAEMQKPRHLLETFVMEVTEQIHDSFSQIKKVEISITKLHAPIAKFTGTVGVSYSKEY